MRTSREQEEKDALGGAQKALQLRSFANHSRPDSRDLGRVTPIDMPFRAAGAQFFCQREVCCPASHLLSVRAGLRAVRGLVKPVQQSSHMCEKLAFHRHFLRFVALIA
jgi:hypothetical protein